MADRVRKAPGLLGVAVSGAVLSTVATLIVTAGLGRRTPALYDPEVTSGAILVGIGTPRADGDVEQILGAVPGARVKTV